jgi:dihydrofolate synthase/folylpolyglutamate synthase
MSYPEAIQFLYDLRLFGAKFGLDNTRRLAALAGQPHERLRFIHVAGTNGKGSTCAMLESIYRAAGFRVGLFTSPHLVSFAERIQVNRRWIPEEEVVRLVGELRPWCDQFPPDHRPTFFEAVTVMALRHFEQERCDVVVWETGLGGRLDATNIVTPLASIITNIGLEHTEWLGETHAKIAAEKAGIIKPGVPVVTAARPGQGLEVIAEVARQHQSALTLVGEADTRRAPLDTLQLPLHGHHQQLNAATALAVIRVLGDRLPVDEAAVRAGLATVDWPGRMQQVRLPAGRTVVLDGAHNPAGAEALRLALAADYAGVRPALVFGVFRDKDWQSMCRALVPGARRVALTPVHSERTQDPAELVAFCRTLNPEAPVTACASLAEALRLTAADPFVVVAGSLYLVGEAMELLHLAPAPARDEKELNEWQRRR